MRKNDSKEIIIVLLIIGLVLAAGLLSSKHQAEMTIITGKTKALAAADFIIKIGNDNLEVGSSSWSAAAGIFPGGQTLGMSTVYSTAPEEYLLTFTEEDNVLCKADIYTSAISTYRDVTTGMNLEQVQQAYGTNYVQMSQGDDQSNFDIIYGTGNNRIVFNFKNQKVWRIVVQQESN